jgi:hypothetical protein
LPLISTLDEIQRGSCKAGFLLARLHLEAGELHGADDLIELGSAILGLREGEARSLHGL